MKVLIISQEVWREDKNGGNILSNIFGGTGFLFAQIYCSSGLPQNEICKNYYQMTDSMVMHNMLNHYPIGESFHLDSDTYKNQDCKAIQSNMSFYSFFHKHRYHLFYWIKEILWNTSNWKNASLNKFVTDFHPDIIFAPCYGSTFMLRLTRYVADLTGKRVISYISDDHYTLKQFNFSLFYWINRFALRSQLRRTFPYYSLVYTMTETQKEQCEKDFGANMKILLKSVPFGVIPKKEFVHNPIRIVYAGGIYLNRWKTLAALVSAIKEINKSQIKFVLDIYTGNEITKKISRKLNDGINSKLHACVSQKELGEIYRGSDIALHVESFDLKNRLAVRMSFSTKIVDCLASGCAVMAICDKKQSGLRYLHEENLGICISNINGIYCELEKIVKNTRVLCDLQNKTREFVVDNLSCVPIVERLIEDFIKVIRM